MQEIKCPKCGEVFKIDESNYNSIVKQIRDHEFAEELNRREKQFKEELNNAIELTKSKAESASIQELNSKDLKIKELEAKLQSSEELTKARINEAIASKDKELSELKNELATNISESKLKELSIKTEYEASIKLLNDQIQLYKDFRAKQTTKMNGESLEQHCQYEFNKLRPTAFRNAYFEKDNKISNESKSKGDFIFKDFADDGTPIVSIMFEMKNETESSISRKHKNEEFFAELDKDRREKECEYAVLVSMLEPDNELYNEGIVDVSYKYSKMYVIRPQFFIPIITLIRNASLNSLDYKRQLIESKNKDLDITNFENNLLKFKDDFYTSFRNASNRFDDAINGIDKTIEGLKDIRENLVLSKKHLTTTNKKVEDINIKKLTKDAPSVARKFEEIENHD